MNEDNSRFLAIYTRPKKYVCFLFLPVKILGRVQQYILKMHTTWLKRKFYNTSIHTLEVLKVFHGVVSISADQTKVFL